MKQTAVDWLINEIDMQYPEINVRRKEWMLDKAKQMENEQIVNAHGHQSNVRITSQGNTLLYLKDGEQYYQETYGEE